MARLFVEQPNYTGFVNYVDLLKLNGRSKLFLGLLLSSDKLIIPPNLSTVAGPKGRVKEGG